VGSLLYGRNQGLRGEDEGCGSKASERDSVMTLIHKFILGGEIYFAAASGLVLVSGLFRLWHRIRGTSNSMPMTPENIALAMAKSNNEGRIHRWLDSLDIFLNTTFMNGQNDETMSAHAWRASLEGHWWGTAMTWWLSGFQPNHGYQAACGDYQRALNRIAVEKKVLGL
jgi:hypothetical protein